MKRFMLVLLLMVFFIPNAYADRNLSTVKGFTASELIQRGDAKVYRVTWYATSANGVFGIYDSLTNGSLTNTTVKTEGSEATSGNGGYLDFTNKPLEFSTGLYIYIVNATVVVEWE